MSNPVPSNDRFYPDDDYKPVRGKYKHPKKKAMAKKMAPLERLKHLVEKSAKMRANPFSNLPPGYTDRDNE